MMLPDRQQTQTQVLSEDRENLLLLVPNQMDARDRGKGFMNHFAKIR